MPERVRLIKILARTAFAFLFLASLCMSLFKVVDAPSLTFSWDKLNHSFGYFLLVGSLDIGFRTGRRLPAKSALVLAYSFLIEIAQYFIPYRDFSLLDMAANAVGIACFLLLLPHLKRIPVYKSLLASS